MPFPLKPLILFFAGTIAGVINSVAGGGTLISFPVLPGHFASCAGSGLAAILLVLAVST